MASFNDFIVLRTNDDIVQFKEGKFMIEKIEKTEDDHVDITYINKYSSIIVCSTDYDVSTFMKHNEVNIPMNINRLNTFSFSPGLYMAAKLMVQFSHIIGYYNELSMCEQNNKFAILTIILDKSINGIVNYEKTNFKHTPINAMQDIIIIRNFANFSQHITTSIYDKCNDLINTKSISCISCQAPLISQYCNVFVFKVIYPKYYCYSCKHKAPIISYIKDNNSWYKLRKSIQKKYIINSYDHCLFECDGCWYIFNNTNPMMYFHDNTYICKRL